MSYLWTFEHVITLKFIKNLLEKWRVNGILYPSATGFCPSANQDAEAGCSKLTMLTPCCCWADVWQRDTALGMSKHSQLCGTYLAGRKVSGALRFSSSSHPGTAGSHRRVKNKVGTHRLDLVQVQASREGEGRALTGSRDSSWLDCSRLEWQLLLETQKGLLQEIR